MLRSSSLILLLGFVFGFSYLSLAETSFKSALTFYVSFDKGTDADIAKGDNQLFTLVDKQPKEGNHTGGVTQLAKGKGLNGDALLFTKRNAKWLFYDGAKNFSFNEKNWSGTVSFWLKVDPIKGLDPGYVDPIQITPNTWNDASFFVDFNKDGNPRSFRLGAFADKKYGIQITRIFLNRNGLWFLPSLIRLARTSGLMLPLHGSGSIPVKKTVSLHYFLMEKKKAVYLAGISNFRGQINRIVYL